MLVDCIREWLAGICLVGAAVSAIACAIAKLIIENGKCTRRRQGFCGREIENRPQFYILHSPFSIHTSVFVFFALIATLSAQKQGGGTNDPPRGASPPRAMPPAPAMAPVAVDSTGFSMPTNMLPVTNLCFWGVGLGTNFVTLGLAWPAALPLANGCIDLYGSWRLSTNDWMRLAEVDISCAESNAVVELPFSAFPTNAMENAAFFVAADQSDSDGDGLSDAYERLVSGSSPSSADTDGDGIPDGDEVEFGANPNSPDTDGDGLPDAAELGVFEVLPATHTSWPVMANPVSIWPSTTVSDGGTFLVNLPCPYTVNGVTYSQIRVCTDGVTYLLDPESPNSWYEPFFPSPPSLASDEMSERHVAVAWFCDDLYIKASSWQSSGSCGTTTLLSGPASVVDIDYIGFADDAQSQQPHCFSCQMILPSGEPNVVYLTYWRMIPHAYFAARNPAIGVQHPGLAPLHAGEAFYNLTWRPSADAFSKMRSVKFTIGTGTDPSSPDTDGDGFPDFDETSLFHTAPLTPDGDIDGDGLPDAAELRIGSDPSVGDTDSDGLDDLLEFTIGTNPLQPDFDGDGMNDGWEYRYMDAGFDPAADSATDANPNNNIDADPDGDGLTNGQECEWGTNPSGQDTNGDGRPDGYDTDGDGTSDGVEVAQNSDPTDASDGGAPNSRIPLSFYFGDHSWSHSEKYRLTVAPVDGIGTAPASFSWLNENYGECETKTAMLKPGWKYEVRFYHAGTDPNYHGNPCPDYDYTLLTVSSNLPPCVIIEDLEALFGVDETNDEFGGEGKVATISVYAVADVTICKPDDYSWTEIEESRVVLDDEELRIKITVAPQLQTLAQCRQMFGNSLSIKASGTCPSGTSVPIGDDALFVNSSGKSEIRIAKTRQQLISLGLLPSQNDDGVNEMAWADIVQTAGQSLADSEAFSSLSYVFRGKATRDTSTNLESTPPNSVPSTTYMKSAGCEILTATYCETTSSKRQIMNQADVFYYSGHGNGATGGINSGFTPNLLGEYWKRDLNCAVIAGCSVLNIAGHRIKSFGMTTRFKRWYRNQHDRSVGALWEVAADIIFLGYCYTAPLDNQGAVDIATDFAAKVKGGMGYLQAWKEANNRNAGRNACAIDCTIIPHSFWYWDETSGIPVWTRINKGETSW